MYTLYSIISFVKLRISLFFVFIYMMDQNISDVIWKATWREVWYRDHENYLNKLFSDVFFQVCRKAEHRQVVSLKILFQIFELPIELDFLTKICWFLLILKTDLSDGILEIINIKHGAVISMICSNCNSSLLVASKDIWYCSWLIKSW